MGPINNKSSLVQIMAWRWPDDKPLSAPMMVWLPIHIYIYMSLGLNELSHRFHDTVSSSRFAGNAFLPLSPPGWRGIVVTVRAGGRAGGLADWRAGGRAGGCQTCGTHISVTARWIFSIRSSMELSRPVVVHCHAHLPICPIWACPWAKNLSNLPQIGSRLCGSHISETPGWIYPI